ncbi:MAG TPA: PAS domain-containing protein [Bryobacteraceae bacterium]|nr:PAS domain-containing protein [Bryobacteraceae bacterium]
MYLVQIFRASPLMGLALCICLTTILWCFLMAKRQQVGLDKILTGVLGLIAIYEAVRVLKDAGVILFPGIQKLDGWVDFLIASMYFIAALILKVSSSERVSTNARLRLVEANEKTSEPGKGVGIVPPEPINLLDSAPLAAFAVDLAGAVIYWNPAAERLLGWKREEVMGQTPPCGVGPLRTRLGREFVATVFTSPVRASSGAVRGTLTIAAEDSSLRENSPGKSELVMQR